MNYCTACKSPFFRARVPSPLQDFATSNTSNLPPFVHHQQQKQRNISPATTATAYHTLCGGDDIRDSPFMSTSSGVGDTVHSLPSPRTRRHEQSKLTHSQPCPPGRTRNNPITYSTRYITHSTAHGMYPTHDQSSPGLNFILHVLEISILRVSFWRRPAFSPLPSRSVLLTTALPLSRPSSIIYGLTYALFGLRKCGGNTPQGPRTKFIFDPRSQSARRFRRFAPQSPGVALCLCKRGDNDPYGSITRHACDLRGREDMTEKTGTSRIVGNE